MSMLLINLRGAGVILSAAIMLASGFLMTRVTKKLRLPNVTGYIIAGVLIGPWCLKLVPYQYIEQMDFITDLALAFIAFGAGRYFKFSALKANGKNMIFLTLFESLTAGLFITAAMLVLGLSMSFSLLLGAIGCATAPASTIMTIRQYKAKGPFIDAILQVVALDDAVALIAFSVCAAFVQAASGNGTASASQLVLPALYNLAALSLGALAGFVLSRLIHKHRSKEHSLGLTCVTIMGIAGACAAFNVSPLLVMFFVLSGMRLSLPSLVTAGGVGILYFLVRIAGKYVGSVMGASVTHASPQVRKFFGLASLGQLLLPPESGQLLSTIILSSGLLYEIVGPACAKAAIQLSGSIPGKEKTGKKGREKADKEETLTAQHVQAGRAAV